MDFKERFQAEKVRLLATLGWLAEGGLIEQLAPLGAGASLTQRAALCSKLVSQSGHSRPRRPL